MTLISNNQLQELLCITEFFYFSFYSRITILKRDAITIDHWLSSYHPRCIKDFILAFLRHVRCALLEDSRPSISARKERRRQEELEEDESVLAGGRKRRRGIVQDNEKKIAAKSGRWRRWETRGKGMRPRPCTVALDCPTVRPVSWTDPSAPGTKGMDGSQITCISDSLVCGAQRLVFPTAVINYDRNRIRAHALSVTLDDDGDASSCL